MASARGGVNARGEHAPQPVKVQRYWPGRAPQGAKEYSSDEEEDDVQQFERPREAEVAVTMAVGSIEITEREAADDRRLRRLREARDPDGVSHVADASGRRRRRGRGEEDEEVQPQRIRDDEELVVEEDLSLRRERLRDRIKSRRQQEEAELQAAEEAERDLKAEEEEDRKDAEEESEGSSEYETDSSEEEALRPREKILKPIFITKVHRETILERERLAKEAEEAARRLADERQLRQKESQQMVAERIRMEMAKPEEELGVAQEVDDTDGLDEQAEYEAWKLRELKRIKRDKEEREALEKEKEELERRRNMTEAERLKEDMERVKKQKEEKPKSKYKFLQKYYHKGAFFMNTNDDIYKRNYTEATPDEAAHKELLPKVMQVKNFGRAGQTKWTHLADQDTSTPDIPWNQKSELNKRTLSKLGGMQSGFDKPTKRHRGS